MLSVTVLIAITACLIGLGAIEARVHRRHLARLTYRVHINGTRGKSSVTRLIAAGLREGGIRTFAKTTGTLARIILPDGRELPVHRQGQPNIIEQLSVVQTAAAHEVQALVIECMALRPRLQ